jgi:hypothetical protein
VTTERAKIETVVSLMKPLADHIGGNARVGAALNRSGAEKQGLVAAKNSSCAFALQRLHLKNGDSPKGRIVQRW